MSLIRAFFSSSNRSLSKCVSHNVNAINMNINFLCPSVVNVSQSRDIAKGVQKRRKTHPFWWLTKRRHKVKIEDLNKANAEFVDQYIKDKYELKEGESPLREKLAEIEEYKPGSLRPGLIAMKIGSYPFWMKDGKQVITTLFQIIDNHVIRYHSPEEFQKICRPFYRFPKYENKAVMVVGAQNEDPKKFTNQYLGLFNEANVMPKKKLTRFFVTENAKLPPGTPLYAAHFRVGDYVDVFGKTIDRGFQGVMKRWHFKGLPKTYGTNKTHRRCGTIARGRKHSGPWRGHKMAGHMGNERNASLGLKIFRINYKYNVIWVKGTTIGSIGNFFFLHDTQISEKKFSIDNPPPFPTYFPDEAKEPLPEEAWDPELHRFDQPTIIFQETEAERKAVLAALKAKTAKKAKIK